MVEFLKNLQPSSMNFKKFRSHIYEFCQFEDEFYSNRLFGRCQIRSVKVHTSVVIEILQKLPI